MLDKIIGKLKDNLESALVGFVRDLRGPEEIPADVPELKMWIILRKDLKITAGKLSAQIGHVVGTCMVLSDRKSRETVDLYMAMAQPKITVGVKTEDQLVEMVGLARAAGLVAVMVEDAARTEFSGRTLSAAVVGPCLFSDLPKKLTRLQTIKTDPIALDLTGLQTIKSDPIALDGGTGQG
jgi:peptidyl-tRNA hydrolase